MRLEAILEILKCFTILIYSFSLACCISQSLGDVNELPRNMGMLGDLRSLFQDNLLSYSISFLERFLCSRVDVEDKAMNEAFLELLA